MKTVSPCRLCLLNALLLSLSAAVLLQAQGNRASITGTVTDQSGAVVQGAEVSAKNLGTGEETRSSTNNDGIYSSSICFPEPTR